MEALTKTGKKIHGVIADILLKKGSATPFENSAVDMTKDNIVKDNVAKVRLTESVTPKKVKKTTKKVKK